MTSQAASEFASDLDGALARLNTLEDRILLARDRIQGRIAFSTSLGLEDQAALHAVAATGAAISLFTLDTGRLFPETLETLAESEQRYGVPIHVLSPDPIAAERLMARDGAMGFRRSIEARQACCAVRKIEPLKRGLSGAAAWLTGLRRLGRRLRSAQAQSARGLVPGPSRGLRRR